LGSLAGIPVRVHATFLLLLAWIALAYAVAGATPAGVVFNLAMVVAVFATIVVHELGHAVVARRLGGVTREITLLPIGGIASMERVPERPGDELAVALVGPAINLGLALVLALGVRVAGGGYDVDTDVSVVHAFVVQLMWIQLALAVFNMLPAFPLDGGRALRALMAIRVGRLRATLIAGRIGMGLAIALGVVGWLTSWWLVVIAMVVFLGAQQELALAKFHTATAPAATTADVPIVPPAPVGPAVAPLAATAPMQIVTGENVVIVVSATPPMPLHR
jgi:Zn-dependent protease